MEVFSTKGPGNILLKPGNIVAELGCSFMVERVIWIWLKEQEDESIDDEVNISDSAPIVSQDVKAHIAIKVDIRVVYLCLTLDLWRFMRISRSNFKTERKPSSTIKALVKERGEMKLKGEILLINKYW